MHLKYNKHLDTDLEPGFLIFLQILHLRLSRRKAHTPNIVHHILQEQETI